MPSLTRTQMLAVITAGGSVSWGGQQGIISLAAQVPTQNAIDAYDAAQTAAAPVARGDIDALDARVDAIEATPAVSPPFTDTSAVVKGSGDVTKRVRIEVDGLTTGTERVWTAPDANTTLPVASQVITFAGPTAPRTYTLPDAAATLATLGTQTFAGAQTIAADAALWFGSDIRIRRTGTIAVTIDDGAAGPINLYASVVHADLGFTGESLSLTGGGSLNYGNGAFLVTPGGVVTIGAGTAITKVLSATSALDFGSIAAGTSADLTITVTGAVAGDTVILGRPAAEQAALITRAIVTAADTVTVRADNGNLITAVDQASLTYRATVIRF